MTDLDRQRQAAIKRVKAKRDFRMHAAVFALANLIFLVGWLLTGPASYFWSIWPFLGWGLGLSYHAWCVYAPVRPIPEDQIRREIARRPF
jgi:hypothetical protein